MFHPSLPLIDLHRHLDGNIRPATIWELASKNNIVLPETSLKQFIPHVQIQESEPDLISFLSKLDWGVKVLKSYEDCVRIAYENVEDAFNAGIRYAELRFSPYYMSMTHGLNVEKVVAAVIEGVNRGTNEFPVKVNLIGILSRTFGVKTCFDELDALLSHKEALVAIDLAGDELNFPGKLFEPHFKLVNDNSLKVTIHAGEAAGPESVWHAIEHLGATRIGHGVAAARDQALMTSMKDNSISIESCLTSNYQTGTVHDLSKHPIKTFLNNELLVCLNTDDPAVEGIELKHEFNIANDLVRLTENEIKKLQKNAIEMCFLSDSDKLHLKSI